MRSSSLQIRLLGHCIICLRKVRLNRKREDEDETTEHLKVEGDSESAPEIAPKSMVTKPGFLSTFNQVWTVLYTKWKDKSSIKEDGSGLSISEDISLKNILQKTGFVSNVSFSKVPTICQLCCDKVLAVENLMKAVRQQVREIGIILEDGRRRQDDSGGLGSFEMTLRDNGLDENVIQATLQFVGVFSSGLFSQDDFKDGDNEMSEEVVSLPITVEMESDEENSLASQMCSDDDDDDNDNNEDYTEGWGDMDDEDPDYIKSEPEVDDDEEDESEEEMEVDEEDKNDPDYKVEKDPLSVIPPKKRRKDNSSCPANEEDEDQGSNVDPSSKFPCSCGKSFATSQKRRNHQRKNQRKHPEYKPFKQLTEDDNKFPCTCGKSFANRKGLREHIRRSKGIHAAAKVYGNTTDHLRQTCELCGKRLIYADILQHLTDHLNGQAEWVIRCLNDKCRYMCVSSKQYNIHLRHSQGKVCWKLWKEKGGPVCEICGFKGTNMLVIRKHLRDKHEDNGEEKKWRCPMSDCGKMFCVEQSVREHLYEHRNHLITEQNCDKCGDNLKVEEVEEHLKDKHGIEEVIRCKQCEMKFSGREEMIEHLYEHREVGILCDICGDKQNKFMSRYSDFREHYLAVHKLCPKKYKCEEGNCDLWFWRKETQEEHVLRMHRESSWRIRYRGREKGTKKFECDVCNVKFSKEFILRSHQIRLHGAVPYTCDICGGTFQERGKFNKHKKEHAGIVWQKEWKCEVEGCGRIFKNKELWKHHEEVGHGGEKKHVCEECGKAYSFAMTLKQHRDAVHLGLRPWVCDECGERFTSSGVLKRHKLIHTGERPFGCDICGQRFRHKEVLRRHKVGHEEKGAGFKPNGPMKQIRKRKAQ